MMMRGVETQGSSTLTSYALGSLKDDPEQRREFLNQVRQESYRVR
jgi:GTP cyclohydrolase I